VRARFSNGARVPFQAPRFFFVSTNANTEGWRESSQNSGFVYGFLIAEPQQHFGLPGASSDARVTSISQRQTGLAQM